MGCDIHVYVEYKGNHADDNWISFGGRINPGRNYAMFALMADVRNYGTDKLKVPIQPRGMPDDSAYHASSDNRVYISDTDGEGYVKPERAKQWVESGSSVYINSKQTGEPVWVTHPDWHSHSWLTTSEFESVINKYLELETGWHKERVEKHNEFVKKNDVQPDSWAYDPPGMEIEPSYQAVLASMLRFEQLGYKSRIVFWFDN